MLLYIALVNLLSQLALWLVNMVKVGRDSPIAFKSFYYFLIFNVNVVAFLFIVQYYGYLRGGSVVSYCVITLLLFAAHFVLDEDVVFRFDKAVNMMISVFMAAFVQGAWLVMTLTR